MNFTQYHEFPSDRKETNNTQVVIGFAESFSAPEVAWSLSTHGFTPLAFARKRSGAALRVSRYSKVFDLTPPEIDAAATVREVAEHFQLMLQAGIDELVVLPLDDTTIWICSQIAPDIRIVILGSRGFGSDFALQKDLQIKSAHTAGFSIPETTLVEPGFDLKKLTLPVPVILKPNHAIALKGGKLCKDRFHICFNQPELKLAIERCTAGEPMLAQRYLAGIGEGLFGLATAHGVKAWSAHKRIRMMNPQGSGASACVSIAPHPDDIEAGNRFIDEIGWIGPFMIELLRDSDGKSWFIEFNGRLWGSTALARRCGLEYPAWAVLEVTGQNLEIAKMNHPTTGIICRHAGREMVHALFMIKGRHSRWQTQWPSRFTSIKELLTFRTDEFWYNWRRDDWRVFIRDMLQTISENVFKKRNMV